MAPDFREEKQLLEVFSEFLKKFTCTVQYNGDAFDQPYLQARLAFHELPDPFEGLPSIDLYKILRPLKGFLKLPGLKQEQMEAFLGEHKRVYCNGGDCIRIYKKYMSRREQTDLDIVMGHNMEDLLGLGDVFKMMGYLSLKSGDFQANGADFDEENLILQLKLPYTLPAAFSNRTEEFYITGQENLVSVLTCPVNGRIRQYYSDYKHYDYLPGEDMAVPKSISKFMEKGLKQSATRDTCYTWFPCSEEFLQKYTKAVVDGRPAFYINLVIDVSPYCDCHAENDAAIVPDVGFFASFDPVALDIACADAVNAQPVISNTCLSEADHEGHDHFGAMFPTTDWRTCIEHAKKIGLGTDEYELVVVK